jgi:hypothetical protein
MLKMEWQEWGRKGSTMTMQGMAIMLWRDKDLAGEFIQLRRVQRMAIVLGRD